jgi:hypothetical protein
LIGIFDISLPQIYGEGKEKAMKRLRKAIREVEQAERDLLTSLRFDQINLQQTTIKHAHNETCEWLLRKAEYLDWLDETKVDQHHGILWIKGNPGTGKSTIIKFVHHRARKSMGLLPRSTNAMHKTEGNDVVIAFFFNARGATLERSTMGMYRSLLAQLLEYPSYLRSAFSLLPFLVKEIRRDYQWNIGTLQELLREIVLDVKSPVLCFVDALDECDEQQIRDMISFLSQVGELAVSANIKFRVCFASRHYPHISIDRGFELILEGEQGHAEDIAAYLRTELRIGQNKTAKEVRQEVQRKSSGIFMWVVLVVGILHKAYDSGHIYALRSTLRDIPGGLHDLFRDFLTRDSHNKGALVLCIQ